MQANLGMKRCKQCEELLALAAWVLFSEPEHALPLMKAQLNRLYGQLHALVGRSAPLSLNVHAFTQFVQQQVQPSSWRRILHTLMHSWSMANIIKLFRTFCLATHCELVMGDSVLNLQLALSCTGESVWFCNTLHNHRQLRLHCVLQRQ